MKKLKTTIFTAINTFILFIFTSRVVLAADEINSSAYNKELQSHVGTEIKDVLDIWINIAAASMVLVIVSGAAMLVLSGNDPRMKVAGKSTVLGAGVTITLLYSTYVIVELILQMFGMSLL